MAAGRPVVCLDLGGPAELVTLEVGIKVLAHTPEQAIADMSEAMIKLAENRDLCVQMGQKGQQRVKDYYSWEAKGKRFAQVYKNVAAKSL